MQLNETAQMILGQLACLYIINSNVEKQYKIQTYGQIESKQKSTVTQYLRILYVIWFSKLVFIWMKENQSFSKLPTMFHSAIYFGDYSTA